jgi:hypothetical protein
LYFQILDEKRKCKAIYQDDALIDIFDPDKMTHTWSYTPHLEGFNLQYADLWCSGASLDTVCPEDLKIQWKEVNQRAMAFLKSFNTAKIDLGDNCLFDLLPEGFLLEFYDLKNQITKSVFENFEKPKNYDFMSDLACFIHRIKNRKLNLKFENLNFSDDKVRNSFGKIKEVDPYVRYNPWATATGRLATSPNSFPILNLNKELRSAIVPTNNAFVELDYNAAELRVMLALLGQPQPKEDIHDWISKNIFDSKYDRDTTKKKVFAWLYNPKAKNKKLNEYLDRAKILEKFYKNNTVSTPYGRDIEVDEEKAVNYIIQSTTSDLFLTSAMKIDKMLKDKKSKIAFCVHDSLVLDMCHKEKDLISEIIEKFSGTKFADFKVNVSLGKNFGSMKKVR